MNSSKIKKEETARTSQMRAARRNSTLPRRAGRPSLSSRLSHVASAVAGAGVAAAAIRWSAVPPEHPSSGASVGSWASEFVAGGDSSGGAGRETSGAAMDATSA